MELIKILFQKAQNLKSIDKLDNVISIVGKNAKHNLTQKEIKSLAKMYLGGSTEIKTSQLKGKDDYLNDIYYYHPSVKSIMEYSNLLRNDLDLSKITNKNDFLDQRVIKRYGSLVPLTELDEDLLRKNQKESTDSQKESDSSSQNNDEENQTNEQTDQNTLNVNEQYPNQQDNNQTNGENGMINNDNYPYAQ